MQNCCIAIGLDIHGSSNFTDEVVFSPLELTHNMSALYKSIVPTSDVQSLESMEASLSIHLCMYNRSEIDLIYRAIAIILYPQIMLPWRQFVEASIGVVSNHPSE